MRLTYTTQQAAQDKCDAIHSALIADDSDYAASVQAGLTLRWAVPYQDVDDQGNVIGTSWYVNVSDRCRGVLTDAEALAAGFPPSEPA